MEQEEEGSEVEGRNEVHIEMVPPNGITVNIRSPEPLEEVLRRAQVTVERYTETEDPQGNREMF